MIKKFVAVAMVLMGGLAGVSRAQRAATEVDSREARRALRAAFRFLRQNPELRANYLRPEFSRETMEQDILVELHDRNGESFHTRLNSDKSFLVDLGTSLRWDRDRKNMIRVYTQLFRVLPEEITQNLLKPEDVQRLWTRGVKYNLTLMTDEIRMHPDSILDLAGVGLLAETLNNPIGSCPLEVGYEVAGSDSELSDRCLLSEYDPDGLFINNDFALKDDLTCIKQQGARGTCVAHALAATVESLAMVDGGWPENLSEQHIYYQGEVRGDVQVSIADMQIYGLYTSQTVDVYDQQNLGLYYESSWNYNRSPSSSGPSLQPDLTVTYPGSCSIAYTGEGCSDYTWQMPATVNIPGIPVPDPPPPIAGPAVHSITSHFMLPMDGGGILSEATLLASIGFLANDVPLVVSTAVSSYFMITPDGYVPYFPNEWMLGGHAMELVGFVPNSELPPGATPAGAQGYFIAKNSWGLNNGDCGFYYLDFEYLLHHANYITGMEIN